MLVPMVKWNNKDNEAVMSLMAIHIKQYDNRDSRNFLLNSASKSNSEFAASSTTFVLQTCMSKIVNA